MLVRTNIKSLPLVLASLDKKEGKVTTPQNGRRQDTKLMDYNHRT